ncbi:hypothetical protein ABZ707_18335 [Streptomyces sp. NPDC006923]|uniref:hypothetical protein n=1 Tax=Streptomyces sp. NPDC006923 TaxID=3155355 RepID=UPI0033D659B9
MVTADDMARQVGDQLAGEFRTRMRTVLLQQPKEWLAEQLLARLPSPYAPPGEAAPGRAADAVTENGRAADTESDADRARRRERVRAWKLCQDGLHERVPRLGSWTRGRLEAEGLLLDPPPKGGALIGPGHRSPAGEALLTEAKDLLYALLFGDADDAVDLLRVERELLTLTLPRAKSHAVGFILRAATEIGAVGTWQDPAGRAHDERAANLLVQVEYGETGEELVGGGIAASLKLINDLEVNEQVLYARMENIEESTLD